MEYLARFQPGKDSWPDVREFSEWLEIDRQFRASGLRIEPDLSYPDLLRSFMDQKREETLKPMIGATVHRNFDRLLQLWPDSRFIHLARDGRDVYHSRGRGQGRT